MAAVSAVLAGEESGVAAWDAEVAGRLLATTGVDDGAGAEARDWRGVVPD